MTLHSSHIRITLLYAVFGIAWILFSDTVVNVLFGSNLGLLSGVQSIKGILYVLITSVLLFALIYYENRERERREADFRLMFMNNPMPMGVYDKETLRFIEANATATYVYGYSRDEFLAMRITDIHPSEDVPHVLERLKQRQPVNDSRREWRHQFKSGEIIHVEVMARDIIYKGHSAVFVAAQNISGRIQLAKEQMKNQALHTALDKEITARANRDRLASMISHDLRTPLTTIMTSASMLDRYNDRIDPRKRSEHYQKILRQTRELNEEFEEILLWLRSENATSAFQPVATNMVKFIRPLLAEFSTPLNVERVVLRFDTDTILVDIDPQLFQRVISNLVSNACKYSDNSTTVSVYLSKDDSQFKLIVSDEGIGIPRENLEKLFESFYRADNAVNVQGTGLGLSIVRDIVGLHNGRIEVNSTLGVGSTFTVYVPLSQQSNPEIF